MEIKILLIITCFMAIIFSAVFGILAAYAELKTRQPKYSIYMKISALLIGIAGVLAALIASLT